MGRGKGCKPDTCVQCREPALLDRHGGEKAAAGGGDSSATPSLACVLCVTRCLPPSVQPSGSGAAREDTEPATLLAGHWVGQQYTLADWPLACTQPSHLTLFGLLYTKALAAPRTRRPPDNNNLVLPPSPAAAPVTRAVLTSCLPRNGADRCVAAHSEHCRHELDGTDKPQLHTTTPRHAARVSIARSPGTPQQPRARRCELSLLLRQR